MSCVPVSLLLVPSFQFPVRGRGRGAMGGNGQRWRRWLVGGMLFSGRLGSGGAPEMVRCCRGEEWPSHHRNYHRGRKHRCRRRSAASGEIGNRDAGFPIHFGEFHQRGGFRDDQTGNHCTAVRRAGGGAFAGVLAQPPGQIVTIVRLGFDRSCDGERINLAAAISWPRDPLRDRRKWRKCPHRRGRRASPDDRPPWPHLSAAGPHWLQMR